MKKLLIALALVVSLGACGSSDDSDEATESPTTAVPTSQAPTTEAPDEGVTVDIEIKDGQVTPLGDRVEVSVGETVTLNVTSDEADEIHVHSDPENELEIGAGESDTLEFTIDTPGQVAVESHHLDVTIVQLVVS